MQRAIVGLMLLSACPLTQAAEPAAPMGSSGDEMSLFFDEEQLVVIATKHLQRIDKAPAIVSVISGQEIRNMGARNIYDVLRREAGMNYSLNYYGKYQLEVRGSTHLDSSVYKLMVDGHSVHDDLSAGPAWIFDTLSIDNVKRIEIIRGPGSALYGSGAFVAVINIVTKEGADINGVSLAAEAGSFGTRHYNIQAGKKFAQWEAAFQIDVLNSDGPRLDVEADLLGQSGKTDFDRQKLDIGLKLSYGDFTANGRHISHERGPNIGINGTLNDESKLDQSQYFIELGYRRDLSDASTISARVYLDRVSKFDAYWEILPEGSVLPLPPPLPPLVYPDGMIGNPIAKTGGHGAEVQFDIKAGDGHFITAGALGEKRKLTDARHITNFDANILSPTFGVPFVPPALVDVSNSGGNWIDDSKTRRDIWAVYLQDLWSISDTLELTFGVRHDDYSDVGSTTNPRAAAVWQFAERWDMKALYGKAFRAPSFAEMYLINNPAFLGNEDIAPQRMETYELSLGHSFSDYTKARVTYFNNSFSDAISAQPTAIPGLLKMDNYGGADTQGLELEFKHRFGAGHALYANATLLDTEDNATKQDIAEVAHFRGNVGGNLALSRNLNLNFNVFHTGSKQRAAGDPRPDDVDGFTLLDMSLLSKNLYPGLELKASVFNVLDEEYFDPAPIGTVTSDVPREGRTVMFEAMFKI